MNCNKYVVAGFSPRSEMRKPTFQHARTRAKARDYILELNLCQFIHTVIDRRYSSVGREAVDQSGATCRSELLHSAALRRVDCVPRVHAGVASQAIGMAKHRLG